MIEGLDRYPGGRNAEDDQTFLLLGHTGDGLRQMSVREKIGVYAEVFGLRRV
ncbi:MAG: hypothetical protein ACM3U2_08045 [Deltaproteobacteria bacterium]